MLRNKFNVLRFRDLFYVQGCFIIIATMTRRRKNQSAEIRNGPKEVNGILARRSRVTLGT